MLKRVFDIVGSLGGLLFFLPCFFVLPILIKKTSPGPVFFRQTRLGLNGKPFVFLKFRSMRVDNDPTIHQEFIKALIEKDPASSDTSSMEQEQVYKIQSDPRVTPIGHFLAGRAYEIPEFLTSCGAKSPSSPQAPRSPTNRNVISPGIVAGYGIKPGKPDSAGQRPQFLQFDEMCGMIFSTGGSGSLSTPILFKRHGS